MHTSKVLDKETDRETKKRKQLKSKVTTDKATNQKAVEITSTALIKAIHCCKGFFRMIYYFGKQ